jgi:hypothetical protein
MLLFTNSTPVALAAGRWYLGVFNADFVPVTYTILVTEYTNPVPAIITLTNRIPYFATNLVQVFERSGKKVKDFSRSLPFKPMVPALVSQRSPEDGVIQMRAELDFVNFAATFGPDGKPAQAALGAGLQIFQMPLTGKTDQPTGHNPAGATSRAYCSGGGRRGVIPLDPDWFPEQFLLEPLAFIRRLGTNLGTAAGCQSKF